MGFQRIESKKLYIRIAEQILERIQSGALPAGSKLPAERDLALQMGVSRPSVREALIALELLGVVEIRIGQGTFVVARPSSFELPNSTKLASPFDLLEARAMIESDVVILVARKWEQGTIDEQAFKKTFEITERMKQIVADESKVEEFYKLGLSFHEALAKSSNNEVLTEVVGNLVGASSHPLWTLINKKVLENREARKHQIQEHEMVLDAIQRGDGETAAKAMRHHLEELGGLVLE